MQINQPKGIEPKMSDYKLSRGVNKQEVLKQKGIGQGLGVKNFWLLRLCGHLEMFGHQWKS